MKDHTTTGRRQVLATLAACIAAPAAMAQAPGPYPSRTIKIVIGYAPASGADVVARLIANRLQESLKQTVVVENRPGAGGVPAALEFTRAPADGYTLMVGAMPQFSIAHATNPKLPYHPLRDFAPVSQICTADVVLIIDPKKVPATNLKELIAWAQKQPITFFGTPGQGTLGHFTAAMLAEAGKFKVEPVHFKATGDSMTALIGSQIHAQFVTYTVAAAQAKAGNVRALAVTSAARSPLFPDTPTMRELGLPDLEVGSWYGLLAPAATPPEILDKLSAELVSAAKAPEIRSKLEDAGLRVTGTTRAEYARLMKDELVQWERVVKTTGFKTQE